jgi:hypothetical protein
LYASPNIIHVIISRRMRWAGSVAGMGEISYSFSVLGGKPEGKRLFGRTRCRWEDNIRMNLREVGWEGVDWIYLAQDRDQWLRIESSSRLF